MATICDKCSKRLTPTQIAASVQVMRSADNADDDDHSDPLSSLRMPSPIRAPRMHSLMPLPVFGEPLVVCDDCAAALLEFLGVKGKVTASGLTAEDLKDLGVVE